jgi:hypothetical protein
MTEKKLGFYAKYVKPKMDLVMFFTIVGLATGFYLDNEKNKLERESKDREFEQRIYQTPLQLQKAIDHDNEVPSDVENFKREIRLIQTGDTLKEQQKNIEKNIKVIDSFYIFSKNKSKKDSVLDIERQKSRDKRTQDVNDIKREQQNIGNTLQAIQRVLDTMN